MPAAAEANVVMQAGVVYNVSTPYDQVFTTKQLSGIYFRIRVQCCWQLAQP